MICRRLAVAAVLYLVFSNALCLAQEIAVAAASDLQFVMTDLADKFQKETGKTVKTTFGSSGNFFQQIQNGAPFDVFFSANLDYAKKLETDGLAEPGTLYQYATGKMVIWVPKDSKLDISGGLSALADPAVKKIAIANPQHAPYGQAAVSALKTDGVYEKVADRFVLGENISQAVSFVVSGAADVGIVALSLALSPKLREKGRYVEIPTGDYPAIEQGCVVLKSSRQKDTAKAFLNYVRTPAAAELFRAYGFEVPGKR